MLVKTEFFTLKIIIQLRCHLQARVHNCLGFSDTYLNLQISEIIDIKYFCSYHPTSQHKMQVNIKLTTCFHKSCILSMNLQKTSAKFHLLTFGAVSNKELVITPVRTLSISGLKSRVLNLPFFFFKNDGKKWSRLFNLKFTESLQSYCCPAGISEGSR